MLSGYCNSLSYAGDPGMHVCNLDHRGEDLAVLYRISCLTLVGKRKILFVITHSAEKSCSPQPSYPETYMGISGGIGMQAKVWRDYVLSCLITLESHCDFRPVGLKWFETSESHYRKQTDMESEWYYSLFHSTHKLFLR